MNYWVFKSEPDEFGIDDLAAQEQQTARWDGIRNYQARNNLRDKVTKGDRVLFYHSNAEPSGVAGATPFFLSGFAELEPGLPAFRPVAMAGRTFHHREGGVQSEVVTLCAEAADLSDAARRDQRRMTERVARVQVRQVDLHRR